MTFPFRIKVCGITSVSDALLASELGADAIGLNFYEKSPRYVEPESATRIVQALPDRIEAVGVFVNRLLEEMTELAGRIGRIRTLQCHGELAGLGKSESFHLVLACSVRQRGDLDTLVSRLASCGNDGWHPDAVLLDAYVPGSFGGTGKNAPWELLAAFQPQVPLILAGGLNAENVAEAIRIVQPSAVDVASGIEGAPGKKDSDKMKRFIDNARTALDKLNRP